MLDNIRVRTDITDNKLYNSIFSTEEVNRMVRKGVPFRDAYKAVSEMVATGSFVKTSLSEYTHEGTIGNLCNKEIKRIFDERTGCFKSKSGGELVEKLLSYS
jgi:argininosuccinate lyase